MTFRALKLSLIDENDDGHWMVTTLPDAVAADVAKLTIDRVVKGLLVDALTEAVQTFAPRVAKALKQQEQLTLIESHRRGEISREDLIEAIERLNPTETPKP